MSGVEGRLRIAVAGGSVGGLCAGLALRGAGFDVQVYERVAGPMETRGAGIVVQGELIDLLRAHGAGALPTTRCAVRRYLSPEGGEGKVQRAPQNFTSWEAIYRSLADAFPSDRYHRGATLTDFGNGEGPVQAHIDGHGVIEAGLLVAADGAQSPTRRRLLPDLSSTYAGYVAWRGTLDEADAPPDLVRFFDDAFTFCEARSAGHILVYFILGDAAFVVRPHTAGATAKAARDATTLARALKRAGRNVDAGLSDFEEMQIEFGQGLLDYGVALGRRWAA